MPVPIGSRPNDSFFPSQDAASRWITWHRHPADELQQNHGLEANATPLH
jgi:hypothetical protein